MESSYSQLSTEEEERGFNVIYKQQEMKQKKPMKVELPELYLSH